MIQTEPQDIFSFGFDKVLNRQRVVQTTPIIYDAVNKIATELLNTLLLEQGATDNVIIDTVNQFMEFIVKGYDPAVPTEPNRSKIRMTAYSDVGIGGLIQILGRSARGKKNEPKKTQTGDVLLSLSGEGYQDSIGFATDDPLDISAYPSAEIQIIATEDYTSAARGAKIVFNTTTDGGEVLMTRMTIEANGSVSLGALSSSSLNVGGGTLDDSAIVELSSTTKGFLPPRMTTTQRNAISSPAAGLMIYNTTTNKLNVYTTTWEQVTSA